MKKKHWIIDVKSWGILYGIGTEEEAEEWRKHKASWEHSVAIKRQATPKEIEQHEWRSLEALLT